MSEPTVELDEYGRPVTGVRAASGPVVPPLPDDHARSPHWPAFLKDFLRAYPTCAGCGRRAETGHHVIPFHVDRARELDPANIAPVCVPCHFVICHCARWQLYVKTARADLSAHLVRVKAAEQELGNEVPD